MTIEEEELREMEEEFADVELPFTLQQSQQEQQPREQIEIPGIPITAGERKHSLIDRVSNYENTLYGVVVISLAELMVAKGLTNTRGPRATRGLANAHWLARNTGMAVETTWALLRHPDKVRGITLESIAKICAALDCQPGEWLSYRHSIPAGDPLLSDRYRLRGEGFDDAEG